MSKRNIYSLCLILATAISLASCLKDDESTVSYYDDTAITVFSLAVVHSYITTTTSNGTTTTQRGTLSPLPTFVIDHKNLKIYNPVALPSNCDLKHVLATISAKNGGQVIIKSIVGDTLQYYSSSDSIDFSVPREIRAYAQDGSGYRAYTVTMNVETSSSSLTWTEVEAGTAGIPEALNNVIAIEKNESGFKLSKDNGMSWTEELLGDGEDMSLLPSTDIGWCSMKYTASPNTEYQLMAGLTDGNNEKCAVWRKIVEKADHSPQAKWVNIPWDNSEAYFLPNMGGVSIVRFADNIYAIGGNGKVYKTRDWGITWKSTNDITLPWLDEYNKTTNEYSLKAATDESGNLWIRNISDGRVWRGKK